MGCNVSRLDSKGVGFSERLRPLLFQRFQEIKARRNSGNPIKDPTHSKKVFLSHIDRTDISQQLLLSPNPSGRNTYSPEPPPKGKEEAIDTVKTFCDSNECRRDMKEHLVKDGRWMGRVKNEKKEDAFTDADEDELEVDDDDGHERMIGYHEDNDAFPGSPSFRVYFNENEVDGLDAVIGKKDGVEEPVSRDGGIPSKDSSVEKKVKRNKKKRSFKKVLPKNLLFGKSCHTPSPSSDDNSHLLPAGKTTA